MSRITTARGRMIPYDEAGAGPPLLLLAGRGWSRTTWRPQIATFAPHFCVIAIDNRDAGENPPENVSYTMADLAADAADALVALRVRRAHIVGHSMGGMIALHLAIARPELVERLVLISTTAGGWSPRIMEFYRQPPANWINDPVARMRAAYAELAAPGWGAAHPAEIAALADLARGNRLTPEGYSRHQGAIAGHDLNDRLNRIGAPTLIIHGARDTLIPSKRAQVLADAIPGARLLTLPDAAHLPQIECADEVDRAILDFLGADAPMP